MGSMGSSGAMYPRPELVCQECGEMRWACSCAPFIKMPDPVFTLTELDSAKELIAKLSNQ